MKLIAAAVVVFVIGMALSVLTKPCEYEDSDNCVWNAKTMGNGEGRSFIVVMGHVFY